jgi:hypothetical protein
MVNYTSDEGHASRPTIGSEGTCLKSKEADPATGQPSLPTVYLPT